MFKPVLETPLTKDSKAFHQVNTVGRTIEARRRYAQNQVVVHRSEGPHRSLYNLRHGQYYLLNAMGQEVWHAMAEPKSIEEITQALSQNWPDYHGDLAEGVLNLCMELYQQGFIVPRSREHKDR